MLNFVFKTRSFAFKMMNFSLKLLNFAFTNEEFCIQNDEFCSGAWSALSDEYELKDATSGKTKGKICLTMRLVSYIEET